MVLGLKTIFLIDKMSSKSKAQKTKRKKINKSKSVSRKRFIIPKIYVSMSTMETIRTEALKYGQFETGGLLLGEKIVIKDDYSIFVKKATGPGNMSEHGTHFFKPDMNYYKDEMSRELYRNSLIYIGEWHKHPGMFDQPSCTDLETMKKITEDDNSKDVLAIIATTPRHDEKDITGEIVQIDFFYYQRGMSDFIEVTPEVIHTPKLKGPQKEIKKINLDVENIIDLVKKNSALEIKGNLTDNGIVNIISGQLNHNPVKVKILFTHDDMEFSLNNLSSDILVGISINNLRINANAWQLDDKNGETLEIPVDLIDFNEALFKRLGKLGVQENLVDKKIALLGVGSVGSAAAAQLVKAGAKEITLIDPDTLEVHNIIRHICDLTDLGRYKTDAVKDKLIGINPDLNIKVIKKDFVKDYDNISKKINGIDLLLVSTDTPDSRQLANIFSVKFNIPTIYISLHERARSGSIFRIVPQITGCRHCVGDGRWGSEFIPGAMDYSEVTDEKDIFFQPGLDSDINLVTMIGVKFAISTLLDPRAEVAPELKTNYIRWNGYPDNNEPIILLGKGIGIPKNDDCEICGPENNKKEKN